MIFKSGREGPKAAKLKCDGYSNWNTQKFLTKNRIQFCTPLRAGIAASKILSKKSRLLSRLE